jgi:hypothetical protein
MASNPLNSISTQQLSIDARKAVDAALIKHKLQGLKPDTGATMIPPGLLGFVLRAADLDKKSLSEVQALAGDVAKPLKGATPATFIHGGHIIIGFVAEGVTLFKE